MANPTGYIKYLTEEEFKKIRNYFQHNVKSPPTLICLEIMAIMGLRIGEATSLKRENFSRDFSTLTYQLSKTGVNRRIHRRQIPSFLQEKLKKFHQKYHFRYREGYLFFPYMSGSKSQHIKRSTISCWFKKMRRALKLTETYFTCKDGKKLFRISPHTLRHHACYRYYRASDNDLVATSHIIGHKKLSTTAHYVNSLDTQNREKSIIERAFPTA